MAVKVAPTIAQQVFTVASGVAGGLAGFVLAKRLQDSEDIPLSNLILASSISAIATFGAAFLVTSATQQALAKKKPVRVIRQIPISA